MSEPKDDCGVRYLLSEMEQELRALDLTEAQIMQKMAELAEEFARQAPYGRHRQLRVIEGGKQGGQSQGDYRPGNRVI